MMLLTALLLAAVFFCSATLTTIAQERYNAARGLEPTKAITQYIHESWNTASGLPQNNGQALCQTRDGYVWIGTQEGLVRFDGMRFTVFNNKNSLLPDNLIYALAEDRMGTLWIGSGNGELLSLRNGRFTLYGKDQGYTATTRIHQILPQSNGSVWLATGGDGLLYFQEGILSISG
jgi:ligand-binding sensor domain-containing protein